MQLRRVVPKPKLTLLLDPRFPGGTSSAVARELHALAEHVDLSVCAIESKMFEGRTINDKLQASLDELGLALTWNPRVVRNQFVAFHNPSCLKFNNSLDLRIVCDTAFIVTHENFLRPCGGEGFDVTLCLDLLDQALLCRRQVLAPISAYNEENVRAWMMANPGPSSRWDLGCFHWFNICDFDRVPPTQAPRDRRGRHSRAGFEKFPELAAMHRHFPAHAEHCAILGGDSFLLDPSQIPEHWEVLPFGSIPVEEFLTGIDFFVYFTHPKCQESFGRVIAEAIAAGKIVITDSRTARTFGDAVIASAGDDIDGIISDFVADPGRYIDFVLNAQRSLSRFGAAAFVTRILSEFRNEQELAHAVH